MAPVCFLAILLWTTVCTGCCTANLRNSSGANASEDIRNMPGHSGTIYFNNPKLLHERRNSFLRESFKSDSKQSSAAAESMGGIYLQDEAKTLSSIFRKFSNEEIGVTAMQAIYDSLPFTKVTPNEEDIIKELSQRLKTKVTNYVEIVRRSKQAVEELYLKHLKHPITSAQPCCDLNDTDLKFNEQFSGRISKEFSCDVFPPRLPAKAFNPGRNLTDMSIRNAKLYPSLKWQYFISSDGIHNEYPAHSFENINRNCMNALDSRHRDVYLATVQPFSKHVVILLDHGNSLSVNQLTIAKAIGKHILSSLSHHDKVGLIGLSQKLSYPRSNACLAHKMVYATHEAKFHFNRFIDSLEKETGSTNHSRGFSTSFEMIRNTLDPEQTNITPEAMIVYISRGLLSSLIEARTVLETIALENQLTGNKVIINTYAVIDDGKPIIYEKTFLQDIADQNYTKYDVRIRNIILAKRGVMLAINSVNTLSISVGKFYTILNTSIHAETHFSLPYWDMVGKGLVVSISQSCFYGNEIIGMVGLDLHLADLVEDITYYNQEQDSYAFLVDDNGYTLMHPSFTRPTFVREQPMDTDIWHLENWPGFQKIREYIMSGNSGRQTLVIIPDNSSQPNNLPSIQAAQPQHEQQARYIWSKVGNSPYTVCIVMLDSPTDKRVLKSSSVPQSSEIVYHRLDILAPDVNMCMHLKQLATSSTSSLFLSAAAFVSPFEYLSQTETKFMIQRYLAYLNDNTKLIANPGLKPGTRSDVAAVVRINSEWKNRFLNSNLNDYIVRRFISTPSGVFLVFPGTLTDRAYDPTERAWYTRALEYPGHVVLTAPYLDVGGAGYIVTMSHTIYEGKADALHGSSDRVVAVMGIDFTVGYFFKLLLDVLPACSEPSVRCFILDDRGYLIAHPGLLDPNGKGPVEQQHITHKEPLVANDILNHRGFVRKKLCNSFSDRTIQRFYKFNTSLEGVLTNLVHGEHCSKYQITAIPGTNVFLGIVNQTCQMITAFCPCSMVDRLCLNCHRMEQTECECPCECSMDLDLCSGQLIDEQDNNPSCPRFPSESILPEVDPAAVQSLPQCAETKCWTRKHQSDCVGVLDCEWCLIDSDGITSLPQPFCASQRKCFGGVLGARTPYADEISGESEEEFLAIKSTPVGPVAGGIMGCFLVLALGVYCYRHHAHRNSHQYISTIPDTAVRMSQLDNEPEEPEPHEEPSTSHSNIVLASFESAANVSPYRVNTGYRRPAGGDSDHGYSTMTPHEDSEHMPYMDPLVIGKDKFRPPAPHSVSSAVSSSGTSSPVPPFHLNSYSIGLGTQTLIPDLSVPPQTVLPDTALALSGPHLLTTAQVHMVDTH